MSGAGFRFFPPGFAEFVSGRREMSAHGGESRKLPPGMKLPFPKTHSFTPVPWRRKCNRLQFFGRKLWDCPIINLNKK